MGVLAYRRQALDPLPVGEARDCWLPPAPVEVAVVVVMVVGDVVVVAPPVDDRDEDDAHDALNLSLLALDTPQTLTTSDTPRNTPS